MIIEFLKFELISFSDLLIATDRKDFLSSSTPNPEKNITYELKTTEIFKASDLMVDSLTQLLAREREKYKQN